MSLIYIFAASAMEGAPVHKIAVPSSSSLPSRCGPNDLVLVTGGMGPKNARSKAEAAFATGKPDAVLVIGLCGGLTPSLPEGRVVAYTECQSTEATNSPLHCSYIITDLIVELLKSSSITCDRVVGITSSRIATTRDERHALARDGATVVDMESYSIVKAATNAGTPVVVLRVVGDSIDQELPDFNRALNDSGALDGRKAFVIRGGYRISYYTEPISNWFNAESAAQLVSANFVNSVTNTAVSPDGLPNYGLRSRAARATATVQTEVPVAVSA